VLLQGDNYEFSELGSGLIIGQIMESSRRYLLQAEIEFWHEMVRLNQRVVSETALEEMRAYLKRAVRDLNSPQFVEQRIAA
jgi:hypothetical protein